jgi:hypothetical protein
LPRRESALSTVARCTMHTRSALTARARSLDGPRIGTHRLEFGQHS